MENIRERVKKTDWYSFDKHENIVSNRGASRCEIGV